MLTKTIEEKRSCIKQYWYFQRAVSILFIITPMLSIAATFYVDYSTNYDAFYKYSDYASLAIFCIISEFILLICIILFMTTSLEISTRIENKWFEPSVNFSEYYFDHYYFTAKQNNIVIKDLAQQTQNYLGESLKYEYLDTSDKFPNENLCFCLWSVLISILCPFYHSIRYFYSLENIINGFFFLLGIILLATVFIAIAIFVICCIYQVLCYIYRTGCYGFCFWLRILLILTKIGFLIWIWCSSKR